MELLEPITDLANITFAGMAPSVLIITLTNVLKDIFPKAKEKLPYLIGIVLFLLVGEVSLEAIGKDIVLGLVSGAMATGGYRLVKPKAKAE